MLNQLRRPKRGSGNRVLPLVPNRSLNSLRVVNQLVCFRQCLVVIQTWERHFEQCVDKRRGLENVVDVLNYLVVDQLESVFSLVEKRHLNREVDFEGGLVFKLKLVLELVFLVAFFNHLP